MSICAGECEFCDDRRRNEDNQALGEAVREALKTGGVGSDTAHDCDGYAHSLAEDKSLFGAAVFRAIADVLRREEARRG